MVKTKFTQVTRAERVQAQLLRSLEVIDLVSSDDSEHERVQAQLPQRPETINLVSSDSLEPDVQMQSADESLEGSDASQRQPSLRYLYPPIPFRGYEGNPLQTFPPITGPFQDVSLFPDVNDPNDIDLDAACFMMLTLDLPSLFGIMARPANRKVKVKDFPEFDDWLHVISDPVVVKIYAGDTDEDRERFKDQLVKDLRSNHGIVLTCSNDSKTLSRNQVNIPNWSMSQALHHLGARICRVQFFGMKWTIPIAEPIIDYYIDRYIAQIGPNFPLDKNVFDYGIKFGTDVIPLYKFSDSQIARGLFREAHVYEMCNISGYGSLDFKLANSPNIARVKIYQELCHEVLSIVQKQNLDGMPKTMLTMRTRLNQLRNLIATWQAMSEDRRKDRLLGIRVEITIIADKVIDGRQVCSELNFFQIEGLEDFFGGAFDLHTLSIDEFLGSCRHSLQAFAQIIQGRNEYAPTVRMKSALTFARQAIGWSGKHMKRQLQQARIWEEAERRQQALAEAPEFLYDGWEQDAPQDRPLIQDFLQNAKWFHASRTPHENRNEENKLMLKKKRGGQYWKKKDIYEDRVEAARYFIGQFGADWRQYVVS